MLMLLTRRIATASFASTLLPRIHRNDLRALSARDFPLFEMCSDLSIAAANQIRSSLLADRAGDRGPSCRSRIIHPFWMIAFLLLPAISLSQPVSVSNLRHLGRRFGSCRSSRADHHTADVLSRAPSFDPGSRRVWQTVRCSIRSSTSPPASAGLSSSIGVLHGGSRRYDAAFSRRLSCDGWDGSSKTGLTIEDPDSVTWSDKNDGKITCRPH